MVTKLNSVSTQKVLKISLWEPFNTPLHRAGLAGLYMVLKHLKSQKENIIDWELNAESITLNWNCTDREALTWLLGQTYQIDNDGIIKIPALGAIGKPTAIAFHNGIVGTFLQHPSSVESAGIKRRSLELDENLSIEVEYKALMRYNHQDAQSLSNRGLYDKYDRFNHYIRIAQWLYPGATEKHFALGGETRLQETPEGLICLLFAPIACSYYQVRSRLKATKYRWALIIPHVDNLETFATIRLTEGFQLVSYDNYFASGVSDASLRYLLAVAAAKTASHQKVNSCEVWAFGDVAWSRQQSVTAHQKPIQFSDRLREKYAICDFYLKNGKKVGKNGTFIDMSFGREIAAENLVRDKPWYSGLHDILKFYAEVFGQLNYEGQNLRNMKEQTIAKGLTSEMATLFCDAFTWQLWKQFSELYRNTSSSNTNYDKLKTDLLMSIRNCRTQQNFAKLQISVFSRPTTAKNPFLQGIELGEFYLWINQNWQDCLSLMTLAIVGYQDPRRTPRTAAILESKEMKKPKYLIDDETDDSHAEMQEPEDNSDSYQLTDDETTI